MRIPEGGGGGRRARHSRLGTGSSDDLLLNRVDAFCRLSLLLVMLLLYAGWGVMRRMMPQAMLENP